MFLSFAGVAIGLALLISGGAALVTGATQIATRFGISPMVIGLTVVAFGTSAPELVVNVLGALEGHTELAFGNVIGSNIANMALVLGAAASFHAINLHGAVVKREVPLLLLVTSVILVMALDGYLEGGPSRISRGDSVILLLLFAIFIYITIQDFMLVRNKDSLLTEIEVSPVVFPKRVGKRYWALVLLGFVLLFIGGELTIRSGVELANLLGLPTAVIGLFVVAIGTSMPELVTSVIAAVRGESDLALGNIVGSNLFNSLMVLPSSGLVATVVVPAGGLIDLVFSWLLVALLIPIFLLGKAQLTRFNGALLLLAYFGYMAFRVNY